MVIANADLSRLSTFGLPARARRLLVLERPDDIKSLPDNPVPFVLGGGSNTLFLTDYPGTIVLNRLRGIAVRPLDEHRVRVSASAGENWHGLVRWCLNRRLYGLENLAMIPGSVGAAPMQNIGAYGVELADVLEAVDVWDWRTREHYRLSTAECRLGYRSSRFRDGDRGRFLITAVHLVLNRQINVRTQYATLQAELDRHGLLQPAPRQVAAAVMRVRRHRLPDPGRIANAGSFFKNPVLPAAQAEALLEKHPALPHWPQEKNGAGPQVKISAAWMIEQRGWKGKTLGNAGVYDNHALVLINRGGASGDEILALVRAIRDDVHHAFDIALEPEPLMLAASNPDWTAELAGWAIHKNETGPVLR